MAQVSNSVYFMLRTKRVGACLLWTGGTSGKNGYGSFRRGRKGKSRYTHQYAYEQAFGAIPKGLEIDHVCGTTLCVEPSHLEAVTHGTNLRRGFAMRRLRQAQHELEELGLTATFSVTKRRHCNG